MRQRQGLAETGGETERARKAGAGGRASTRTEALGSRGARAGCALGAQRRTSVSSATRRSQTQALPQTSPGPSCPLGPQPPQTHALEPHKHPLGPPGQLGGAPREPLRQAQLGYPAALLQRSGGMGHKRRRSGLRGGSTEKGLAYSGQMHECGDTRSLELRCTHAEGRKRSRPES